MPLEFSALSPVFPLWVPRPPHPLEESTCPVLSFIPNHSVSYELALRSYMTYFISFIHSFIASIYCWLMQLIRIVQLLLLSAGCCARSWEGVGNGVQSLALPRLQQDFESMSSGNRKREAQLPAWVRWKPPPCRWGLSRLSWGPHLGLLEWSHPVASCSLSTFVCHSPTQANWKICILGIPVCILLRKCWVGPPRRRFTHPSVFLGTDVSSPPCSLR